MSLLPDTVAGMKTLLKNTRKNINELSNVPNYESTKALVEYLLVLTYGNPKNGDNRELNVHRAVFKDQLLDLQDMQYLQTEQTGDDLDDFINITPIKLVEHLEEKYKNVIDTNQHRRRHY
jgi:uncharacterized protein YukJ